MKYFKTLLFFITCTLFSLSALSQVKLPRLVSDGMVLQRNEDINIWGWATPGEKVTVKFNSKSYSATADNDSIWKIKLRKMNAGGPYTMDVKATNHITISNILVGDVWLCAGQSNMVHQMRLHGVRYADEIAKANYPEIRQFFVPNVTSMEGPKTHLPESSWKSANPTNVTEFSAVAYFFAKDLYEKYHVPIGIINASWGGTPVEAWISEDGFKDFPEILETVSKNKDTAYVNSMNKRPDWGDMKIPADKGMDEKWYDPAYIPKGWHTIAIPGYWEDQGVKDLNGIVWYRREINVPEAMATEKAKVFLGRIVDADELYINGEKVGNTTYMYPQRRYQIPDGLLKPGKNLFVVKVTNNFGKGGFVPDKPYQLITDNDTIDLTGYWQYKVGRVNLPFKRGSFGGGGIAAQNQPTALYNSMIAPYINYNIKGIAWYQGESNAGRPDEYTKLQTALITNWRNKFHGPNLPFIFVQLPGFMDYNYLPSDSQWAQFREAQAKTLSVPNTAMAVAIDLGEWNDIHPDRKKEVGDRIALLAEKIAYGEKDIVSSGPMFKSAEIKGNKIIISFTNTGSGLTTSDGEAPAEFAIAGEDKEFAWANAKIEGSTIVLWNDDIPEPKYVRYAWADNPVNPNLINKEKLPAAPFRTDE
ncbi:sialate O-acetylesterase [Flavobacterium rhizosphaerae]|uniref:Sialate O-acetylesterase n=1 Tax=Flavobacterium rhizosphaerae TaxID=3163298 RepID=A0ABW8YWQ2_9FLAO